MGDDGEGQDLLGREGRLGAGWRRSGVRKGDRKQNSSVEECGIWSRSRHAL